MPAPAVTSPDPKVRADAGSLPDPRGACCACHGGGAAAAESPRRGRAVAASAGRHFRLGQCVSRRLDADVGRSHGDPGRAAHATRDARTALSPSPSALRDSDRTTTVTVTLARRTEQARRPAGPLVMRASRFRQSPSRSARVTARHTTAVPRDPLRRATTGHPGRAAESTSKVKTWGVGYAVINRVLGIQYLDP